jgi:DNA (cytosine-5)-methyltransferase 1
MSTFSGISAASVAWKPLGWEFVAYAEPASFQAHVLNQRCGAGRPRYLPEGSDFKPKGYADIPEEGVVNFGDISQITDADLEALGPVDILEGSPPCQAFSVAGLRGGLDDERGNLSLTYVQLAQRMRRINGIKYVTLENVVGMLNEKSNPFGCILAGFAGESVPLVAPGNRWTNAGHVDGQEARIAWRVLDAQFFGVAQRRRRVFVVVSFDPAVDPGEILFERHGEAGRSEARVEARQEGSGSAAAGAGELTALLNRQYDPVMDPRTAHTLVATDYKDPPAVVYPCYPWQMSGGSGGVPGVGSGIGDPSDPMYTLMSSARQHGVIYALQSPGAQPNANGFGHTEEGPMYTLDTTTPHGVVHPEIIPTLLASGVGCDRMGGMGGNETEFVIVHPDTIGTLMTTAGASKNIDVEHLPVMKSKTGYVARRLMPVECERLQGFPDFWTDIIVKGKPAADAPRYRGLGNSVAVPVLRWIGRRLQVASKDSMA